MVVFVVVCSGFEGFGVILCNLTPPNLCGNLDCKLSVQRGDKAYSLPDITFQWKPRIINYKGRVF